MLPKRLHTPSLRVCAENETLRWSFSAYLDVICQENHVVLRTNVILSLSGWFVNLCSNYLCPRSSTPTKSLSGSHLANLIFAVIMFTVQYLMFDMKSRQHLPYNGCPFFNKIFLHVPKFTSIIWIPATLSRPRFISFLLSFLLVHTGNLVLQRDRLVTPFIVFSVGVPSVLKF